MTEGSQCLGGDVLALPRQPLGKLLESCIEGHQPLRLQYFLEMVPEQDQRFDEGALMLAAGHPLGLQLVDAYADAFDEARLPVEHLEQGRRSELTRQLEGILRRLARTALARCRLGGLRQSE